MKWFNSSILLFCSLVSVSIFGAEQKPLKVIAKKACTCTNQAEMNELNTANARAMKLGICIIKASRGHESYLKEKHGVDLSQVAQAKHGEKLGYIVALEMADICSASLAKMTNESTLPKNQEKVKAKVLGKFISIKTKAYVKVIVEDSSDANCRILSFTRLYLIFNFKNSKSFSKLTAFKKGSLYEFEYIEKEVYFATRNEYSKVKIITGILEK